MPEIKGLEINCQTGEEIEVTHLLSDEEWNKIQNEAEMEKISRETQAKAIADARISALAKLTALGLTEEEATALLR